MVPSASGGSPGETNAGMAPMDTRAANEECAHNDVDETIATPSPVSREIRAVHDDETVRVYQAYNESIADAALESQSFRSPLEAGLWSATRMTWIKPSKVWMAYRCGWTLLKDTNQSRVLALDLSRRKFEELIRGARVSSHVTNTGRGGGGGDGGKRRGGKCRDSDVVVQWDPERVMKEDAPENQVFTAPVRDVRSIQIGLRGKAVEMLLDPEAVVRITDVTEDFRGALEALRLGDLDRARALLWPSGGEEVMEVSTDIREVLGMNCCPPSAGERKKAVVVLGSAANPPHRGHFHCLKVGMQKARDLGYEVLFSSIAPAPEGYVKRKMSNAAQNAEQKEEASQPPRRRPLVLSNASRLRLLDILASARSGDKHSREEEEATAYPFRSPRRCYGSALECGVDMRPSEDVAVIVVVGGDRAKSKWRRAPKESGRAYICCARDEEQFEELRAAYAADQEAGMVREENYHFVATAGPPTSSTLLRSILQDSEGSGGPKVPRLFEHGYSEEAAEFLVHCAQWTDT